MADTRWREDFMNQTIKAYFFSRDGFEKYLEKGFPGWPFVFFVYIFFIAALVFVTAGSFEIGLFTFIQPLIFLFLIIVLTALGAVILGAEEPIIRGLRLVAVCLPPTGLAWFFLAMKSVLVLFMIYPAILFIYGSAFIGSRDKALNIFVGFLIISLTIGLTFFESKLTARIFDHDLVVNELRLELRPIKNYDDDEISILSLLVIGTPKLGMIPQAVDLAGMASVSEDSVRKVLYQLDLKGDIIITSEGEIRFAYPWADFDNGYQVFLEFGPGSVSGPLWVSDALHGLGISALFAGSKTRINSTLKDTGDSLFIEVADGQIVNSDHPEAVVYQGASYSDVDFYSSPSGAKTSHPGRFDATRLLRLDRALIIGESLTGAMKDKWIE